ncbi:MafI family immunity protein [Actinokineospora diospyrosa]|uniref:MafI family immunity protein n=1 Tax=Actinokineospora diospyrosa TaxID=103728 RepID=A0ABT1IF83_9PSEU|nr:MafI family immunity protein [Actinokineospora diospyrosa]MCP2271303.1 hypothetical protein [Actinokineospora diospyrosa]
MEGDVDYRWIQAGIMELLAESPITSADVRQDIKESVYAGELDIAFDTLCSWIYEDSLPISRAFHAKAMAQYKYLNQSLAADKLVELIDDDPRGPTTAGTL